MEIDYDSLFYFVDNFRLGFEPWYKKQLLRENSKKRDRSGHLSLSEILTILLAYHQSGMSCFQIFLSGITTNQKVIISKACSLCSFC